MPANDEEHLGEQFRMFHGTAWPWITQDPQGRRTERTMPMNVTHERPLHFDTDIQDFPKEKAFDDFYNTDDPNESREVAQAGRVMEFRLKPGAKVHYTNTPHMDGVLPDEELEHIKNTGVDVTLFRKGRDSSHFLGLIHNAEAIEHVKTHRFRDVIGSRVEDELAWKYGDYWGDD